MSSERRPGDNPRTMGALFFRVAVTTKRPIGRLAAATAAGAFIALGDEIDALIEEREAEAEQQRTDYLKERT